MLFIDLIDIIYLVIGAIVGASTVAYLDSRTCDECERSDNCEE